MDEAKRIATKVVMEQSDKEFVRVLEDLIEILTKKGVVYLDDLPSEAKDKLMQRKVLREG